MNTKNTLRKRILLIAPYSSKKVGGIGTWSINVLSHIKRTGIVDVRFQNTAFNVEGFVQHNIFLRIPWGFINMLRIFLIAVKNLFAYKPSTVHYTSSASFALFKDYIIAFVATKIFKTHFVIHWHFGRIPILRDKKYWEWRWLLRVSKLCSSSIVIDKKSLMVMRPLMDNVIFVPNPISLSLENEARKMTKGKRQYAQGEVVFVGHVVKTKGICELVKACTRLDALKKLTIVGPCGEEMKRQLISLAQMKGDGLWMDLKGEVIREQALEIIKQASCLCLPSYTEGFPNVVMEAMALGVPVVATNVGAIDDMLDVAFKEPAGICVPVRDVEALEEALASVLDNVSLAEQLGRNGNRRVLSCYVLDQVVKQYNNVWR